MPTFTAPDGTRLAYRRTGDGTPLVCLPGGPMQDSAYLGDLVGLPGLVLLDPRGTGASEKPSDTATYRCDHQVGDVEALREHLGVPRLRLLAHSAGANLAVSYASRHPERVELLVLVTPSTFATGVFATAEQRRAVLAQRAHEPWYAEASAAFERIAAGEADPTDGAAIAPCTYGTWDEEARQHYERGLAARNDEAAALFGSPGAYDHDTIRAALADLPAPVLMLTGGVDLSAPPAAMAAYAALFRQVTPRELPGGGHFPWLDDPAWFRAHVDEFLAR